MVIIPLRLAGIRAILHVSQCKMCLGSLTCDEPLDIQLKLTYEELLDRKKHQMGTKTIPLVKILW